MKINLFSGKQDALFEMLFLDVSQLALLFRERTLNRTDLRHLFLLSSSSSSSSSSFVILESKRRKQTSQTILICSHNALCLLGGCFLRLGSDSANGKKSLPLTLQSCLKWSCGGAAARYDANLGLRPGGLAGSYGSSQQPTTIVSVFVDGEMCRSNPSCGGERGCGWLRSTFEGLLFWKGFQRANIEPYTNEMKSILLYGEKRRRNTWSCKSPTLCCVRAENSFFQCGYS